MLCLQLHDGPGEIAGSRHVAWEVTDGATSQANGCIDIPASLGHSLRDKLRWYVEEFPNAPFDPAPAIAARIASQLQDAGEDMFAALMNADTTGWLARCLRDELGQTRVAVMSDAAVAPAWEVFRGPETGARPALAAKALIRQVALPRAGAVDPPADSTGARILLVVSRPAREDDVPFQSVARPLLEALSGPAPFELEVLRPATWGQLRSVLRDAHKRGRPFTAVHFDGHGVVHEGRGYLVFESADGPRPAWVDGTSFGRTLSDAGVRLALLNACRSAAASSGAAAHSLAEEAMIAGLSGVVAMQFNLFVAAARHFVGELYARLGVGKEPLRTCAEILEGDHDDLPTAAIYFAGGIDEIRARAQQ